MAIWTLCRVVQMAVHFFVNYFNVFKSLYLAYYWIYLHQTWGFCKAWYALGVRHLQTADLQTCRLADLQTCRLADLQTCRLADLQTCRLADLESQHTSSSYPKSFLKSAQPPLRITCLPEFPPFRSKQT